MELILTRQHFNEVCTIGELTGFQEQIFTLEDTDRNLSQTDVLETIKKTKVFGQTAIPYGRYEVAMTFSNHFQKFLPLVMSVPGWDGVRIHSGNVAADSLGCILVGLQKDVLNNRIAASRIASGFVNNEINEALKKEKVFLTIKKL